MFAMTVPAGSARIVHVAYLINFTFAQSYQFDPWFDCGPSRLVVLIVMITLYAKRDLEDISALKISYF